MDSRRRFGWRRAWLWCVAVFYVGGSLILMNPSGLYVSPDETANAYFARRFADTFSLQGPYDILLDQFDRLHPRSALVLEGRLVPAGFLGLPFLYGLFIKLFGSWVLWFLTPLLTIFAAHGWRRVVERVVSVPIGTLAFAFFLLHPAIWYYSARGLMPNVLFLDLLVLATWFWVCHPVMKGQRAAFAWNDGLAGFFVGLALFVRASEIIWVGGLFLIIALVGRRNFSWKRWSVSLSGVAVGLGLLMAMNALTYGNPFTTGYTVGTSFVAQQLVDDDTDAFTAFPFAIDSLNAWRHFSDYGLGMFWWLAWLALPGVFIMLTHKKHQRVLRWVLALTVSAGAWLVLFYGSWEIHDNPDPVQITIANSYVRYWLPLYAIMTPMMALTVRWIASRGRSDVARRLIVSVLLLSVISLNMNVTFFQGEDALLSVKQELEQSARIQSSILMHTQEDAIIIVDRGDKLVFPDRRVWYPLRDEATFEALPALLEATTLYYYGITFPPEDFDYLNHSRLRRMGLGIELLQTYEDESLYQITAASDSP